MIFGLEMVALINRQTELNMFRSYNIENILTFRILDMLKIDPFAAISDSWFSKRNIPVVPNQTFLCIKK